MKYYVVLAISIAFNSASLVLLKKGALAMEDFFENLGSFKAWLKLLTNTYMLLAIFCFGAAFVTWMIALKKLDLSLAYPLASTSYIAIAIISCFLFNETISITRWAGIGIIMVGVGVMFYK